MCPGMENLVTYIEQRIADNDIGNTRVIQKVTSSKLLTKQAMGEKIRTYLSYFSI
jgi:hypothetical protein